MPVKPHSLPQMQEPVYRLGNLRTGLHMFHNLAVVTISDSQPLASPGLLSVVLMPLASRASLLLRVLTHIHFQCFPRLSEPPS